MKIVMFLGGLGNQMFQYAFYLSLKDCFKTVKADLTGFDDYPLHNGFELQRAFGLTLDTASSFDISLYSDKRDWAWRKLRRLYGAKDAYYRERGDFTFDESIYDDRKSRYFWGYWQNIGYVNRVETKLRAHFTFLPRPDAYNDSIKEVIGRSNAVSVHVRRGDYMGHPILGGICDQAYYQHAVRRMSEETKDPLFLFFSDDIPWCREVFKNENAIFVDRNVGADSYRDMELMSLCNHHIISNSSFSWWGAWLNSSEKKIVISPSRWVNDFDGDLSGMLLPSFTQL